MANLVEAIYKRVIRPYQYTILLVLTTILFSVAAYYAYEYYFQEQTDIANRTGDDPVQVYLFHVDWCPHCRRAMPEWSSFKQQYDGKVVNSYKVECIDVDCTDEDSEVANYINKYDIDSYPTVKMQKGDQTVSFDASVTSENLESFVEMILN
jgi:thiol-disulfide isomerase/thioredoxin